jgi:hypothetical protein
LLSEDHDKRTKEIKERQNNVKRGTVEHEHNFQLTQLKVSTSYQVEWTWQNGKEESRTNRSMSKNGMVCRQTYFSVGLLQQLIDSTQASAVFTRLIEDDRKEKERHSSQRSGMLCSNVIVQ